MNSKVISSFLKNSILIRIELVNAMVERIYNYGYFLVSISRYCDYIIL